MRTLPQYNIRGVCCQLAISNSWFGDCFYRGRETTKELSIEANGRRLTQKSEFSNYGLRVKMLLGGTPAGEQALFARDLPNTCLKLTRKSVFSSNGQKAELLPGETPAGEQALFARDLPNTCLPWSGEHVEKNTRNAEGITPVSWMFTSLPPQELPS